MADVSTIFETERLVVRTLGPDDAGACFAIYGDPEVTRYVTTGGQAAPAVETIKLQLEQGMLAPMADPRFGFWAMEGREDNNVVGTAALIPLDDAPSEFELGWHLARPFWGQGYAFESGIGLLEYGFGDLGLDEILALAHPENDRSIRACKRLGMTPRQPRMNQGYEHACFGATRDSWTAPSRHVASVCHPQEYAKGSGDRPGQRRGVDA